MPKDIDEDLIEATIRRVQAQASPPQDGEDPEDVIVGGDDASESGTDATRPTGGEAEMEDPIEATIRRVRLQAEEAAARSAEVDSVDHQPIQAPASAEIDPIAETIRRVQSQAVARSMDESSDFAPAPVPPLDDADVDDVDDTAATGFPEPPVVRDIEATSWPGRDERLLGDAPSWEVAARRLEQGLQDNSRQVREFAARLDAILPAIERLLGSREGAGLSLVPQPALAPDDEWDEAPRAQTMQFGEPPRPAVLRDPSPQTATARELEEEPVAPAAHLRPVERDSLDERLPRQYRITVEDKRRGVDLVPLHRAMQGLHNVRDMSLLSYSNGVAMVLVETVGALEPEPLREAVGRAMARETLIEVHNESTMVVKVQED